MKTSTLATGYESDQPPAGRPPRAQGVWRKRLTASCSCWVSLAWTSGWASPPALTQRSAELAIEPYAGLTIRGTVGAVYVISYVSDPARAISPSAWQALEFLQLPESPHLWVDRSAPLTLQRFYRAVAFEPIGDLVFIPPGLLRMGSPDTEVDRGEYEDPQTTVLIRRGFWMGAHEVTQAEYGAVMGSNPSWYRGEPERPVEQVSWEDASRYCARLTAEEQMVGRIPPRSRYRLPTEAEWEYACRAWTSTRFSHGDDAGYPALPERGWFAANSGFRTHAVAQKRPNPWGLYDMHGNVSEWCQDWFDAYPGGTVANPSGPDSGTYRVFRGGSWGDGAGRCRAADRRCTYPDSGNLDIGFRVVLAVD